MPIRRRPHAGSSIRLASSDVTPPLGSWDADAVVVNLRPARIFGIVLNLLIFTAGIALLLFGVIIPNPDWRVDAVASFFIVCCLVPIIRAIRLVRPMLVPMGFAFDQRGLHYWRGSERGLFAWSEIAAIGIGYESPPQVPPLTPSLLVARFTVDKVVKDRHWVALEIFPRTDGVWDRAPALQPYRWALEAPWPDVSAERWLIPLPPRPGLPRRIQRGAERFAPQVWRGWFRRPWRSLISHARQRRRPAHLGQS
jgi:hypothetical protein